MLLFWQRGFLDSEDFRRFELLAQTLHFGRAARALGMSPSALTRRVQAMEEELGQPLLLRDQRSVRLTTAGERFRKFARAQSEQWEQLKNDLSEQNASPTGELHIACTVTACHSILPRLLSLSRKRHPGLTLRLITQDATRSLVQLEEGEVDLAVIPTDDQPPPHLEALVLGTTELAFIAPRDSSLLGLPKGAIPRDAATLMRLPLVAPIGGLERKRLDAWLAERDIEPHIVAEVRGNEGLIAMVSLGSGIALVPRLVLDSSPLKASVRVLTELEPPPGYDVALCARPKSLRRDVVRVFWELAGEASR